jgi:hypothetical protein
MQRARFWESSHLSEIETAANNGGTESGALPYKLLEALMFSFLLWCILLVMCWPLALVALVLYPLIWLVLLPFRIVGIAVGGVLDLVKGIIFLPARVLRGRVRA